jgi:hypothetical protein
MKVLETKKHIVTYQFLVMLKAGLILQTMYQKQQAELLHITSAIFAFFTPPEIPEYGNHPRLQSILPNQSLNEMITLVSLSDDTYPDFFNIAVRHNI